MPPRLVHLALFPVTTSPLVGFVIALIPLPVLVIVTTLVKSWKNCAALELKQHRYLKTGVSAVFLIGFYVTLTHALHHLWFCSQLPFPCNQVIPQVKQWKAQLRVSPVRRVLVKVSHTTCGILSWNSRFTGRLAAPSNPLLLKLIRLGLHSRVILLLTYSATKKVLTILHNASSGTIAR